MRLKAKMTLEITTLVILLMAGVALSVFLYFKRELKATISHQQFMMLCSIADEIDGKLLTVQQLLTANAKTVPPAALRDPEEAQRFLDSRAGLLRLFDNRLMLLTSSGVLIAESPLSRERRGMDFSFRPVVKNTLASGRPCISDPQECTHEHRRPVIMFTAPVFDGSGRVAGILAGSLDLTNDNFLGKLARKRIGSTGYLSLTTTDRTRIIHPDQQKVFTAVRPGENALYDKAVAGFEGTGETVPSSGIPSLSSFKRLKANDWILAANFPLAEAYAPVHNAQKFFLLATLGGLLVVFVVISHRIRHLTSPLDSFTRHIKELTGKKGEERLFKIDAYDEIGTLSRAFNALIGEIDAQQGALQRSGELYRTLADFATDFIFWRMPDKTIAYVSPNCVSLTGYAEEEFYADPGLLDGIVHPDERQLWRDHVHEVTHDGLAKALDFRIITKSGETRWVSHVCKPIYNETGALLGVRGSHSDITDRTAAEEEKSRLESQLFHSQKMEAVGQLAGGVAHDFNNLLTAVIGNASLMQLQLEDGGPLKGNVDQILSAADKAARLTRSLLMFSRKQAISPEPVEVNELLRGAEKLLRGLIPEDIELRIELSDEALPVVADTLQMEQVMINLAANARDAMPDGGVLTITTAAGLKQLTGPTPGGAPERCAVISVADTGTGIDNEIRERIFDPFFTTKEIGKGTGLGLAIVFGAVKQHNGIIEVQSEPGTGTAFTVYLPLAEAPDPSAGSCGEPERSLPAGGAETVLLAEDSPETRSIIKEILEGAGYRLIEARDGEDAVDKFRAQCDDIRLVVLDAVMPKKNGKEAWDAMQAIRPGVAALFMSGYSLDVIGEKGMAGAELNFIQKPLSPQALLKKVREILDAVSGA